MKGQHRIAFVGGVVLAIVILQALPAQNTVPPPGTGAANGVTLPPPAAGAPGSVPGTLPSAFIPRPGAANPAAVAESPAAPMAKGTNPASIENRVPAALGNADPQSPNPQSPNTARAPAEGPSITRVTRGPGSLPSDAGQVWREYDISPYVSRVAGTGNSEPERAVVDWILRDTGAELWFKSPLGLLNADRSTVRVYHTPDVHQVVNAMIDRFNANANNQLAFQIRLITIGNPNWRVKAQRMLRPVSVKTPGVEAWLVTREESAFMLTEASKRNDFRVTGAPSIVTFNGQSAKVESRRAQTYVKSYGVGAGGLPKPESAEIEEGYELELSPLLTVDKRTIEAVVRCDATQIERLSPVSIEAATPGGPAQRLQVQVPQTSSWKLHERFRWPADQLLLISVGLVPTPLPEKKAVLGLSNPFDLSAPRAEALIAVEYRGLANESLPTAPAPRAAVAPGPGRGRY